jgi:hypothetical protein
VANFCVKCGSALTSGPFCTKCGADARSMGQSIQPQQAPMPAQPQQGTVPAAPTGPQPGVAPWVAPSVAQPVAPKQGMSALAKLGIAALGVILVGGAAGALGVYYVAHKVSQKYHEVSDEIRGSSSGSGSETENGSGTAGSKDSSSTDSSLGDVCRFLSKEDVSKAIGVEIIRTQSKDNGCSYIAKGNQADIMAKHASAMIASRGADKKTQQIVQQFAGGMFKQFQSERPQSEWDKSGEVLVFNFSVDQHAAEAQMRLNAEGLGRLGDMQDLPGIGDQAFVSGEGMIMIRKGNKLVRIMYITCPCGTEAVKPLAEKLVDRL